MSVDMRDLAQDAVLCRRISPQIYHAMLHEPTLQTDEFEALYLAWWNANEAFEKAYEKYEADTISWFPFYPSALDLAVQRARQNMAEYCSRQDTVTRVLEHASQNKVLKKAQVIFAERHAQDLNASSWGDVLSNLCSEITPSKILLGLATVNFAAAQPVLNHVFPNTNNAENITGGMSVGLPKSVSPAKVSSPALESAKNRQKREKKQQKVEDIFVTTEPSLKKSITDFRKAYLKFYKGNSAAVITADVLSTDSRDHGILMKEAGAFLGRYSSDIQEGKRKYPELIASLEEHAPYSAGASLMLAVIHVLGGGNSDDAVMLYVQAYLKLPSLFEGEDNYSWAEGFLGAVTFRMKIALDALGALTKEEDYVQEKNLLVLGEVRVLSDLAKAVHENLKPYGNPMNTKTLVLAEEMMGVVKVWEKAIQTAQEKLAKQKHVDVKQPKKETVVPKSEKVAAAPVTTDQALKDVLFELVTFYKTQPVSQKGFVSSKGGLFQEGTILPEVMTMGMQVMANFDSSHKGASAGYNAYLKKNPSVRDKIFAEATKGNGYASYLLASIQPEGQPEAVVFAAQCVRKPDKKDKNPYAGVELFLNVAQQRLDTLKGNASAQDEIAHIEIAMKAVREYQDHAKNPKKVSEESKPLQEDIDWILSGIAKSGKQKEYTQRLGLDLTLKSFTVLSPSDRWDLNNAFSLSKLEQDIITIRDYAFRGSKEALRYMYVAATHETRFADAALVALQAVRLEPTEEHYVDLHNAIASILDREYPKIGGMLEDRDTFDPVYYDQMLRWFEISRRALEHITVESSIYKKMFNRWSDLITRDAFAKTGVQILPKPASQADYKNYHNALASASPGESVIEIHMTWASKGVVDASLALIDLYRKGYEISQSFDQARLLYRIALIQAGNDQAKRKQVEEKWPLIEPRSAESPINWLIARVTGIEERALPRGLVGPIVVTMIFIHVLLLSSLYSMAKRFFRRQPERVIEQPKKESPPKLKKQRKTPQESAAKVKDGEYKKLCAEFDAMKARFEKLKRKQEQYQLEKCKAPIKACEIIFAKTYSVETIAELKQDIETLKIHCAELENIIDLHEKSEEKNKKYTAVLAALDKVKTDALSVAAVP
ncbi:MAG: hypothetical protein SFW07_05180, partial [Gammaproteobacteria bacterium]|nr:hypothetical protein [Gammaproteobacteria bacterium]